jgi:hypothetical protein
MYPDLINGLFEFLGGVLICLSIYKLHKQKIVRGVSPLPVAFFALWGYWNLLYYPSLHQWFSFFGGLVVVTANTIWVIQMYYYLRKEKRK